MSAKDFIIPPGEGAVWHMAPGRSATLKITSDIAQSVMMFEEVAPTDTVTDLHIHHDSDEVAYVLSGEVTFMIGDQVTVGGAGTCAFMPRGLPHAWKSTGSEPGRVLFLLHACQCGQFF
jgi:mannose-6-phosphate isomerase-like protein (cupin superfamily)